jgi:hypothetical protein
MRGAGGAVLVVDKVNSEELLAEANQATERLRAATREGRELLRDLKEARREIDDLMATAKEDIMRAMKATGEGALEAFGEVVREASTAVTRKMNQRFNEVLGILMGEDNDDDGMAGLARTVREAMEKSGVEVSNRHIPPALRRRT